MQVHRVFSSIVLMTFELFIKREKEEIADKKYFNSLLGHSFLMAHISFFMMWRKKREVC